MHVHAVVAGVAESLGQLQQLLGDPARDVGENQVGHHVVGPAEASGELAEHPEVANKLLAALARRLRRTNEAMADLVFSDVPGRVAKALLDLASRFGVPTDDGLRVTHDLTQEELAQLVGASRETVNKALADFAGRGFLRLEGRAVVILDIERLTRRAG